MLSTAGHKILQRARSIKRMRPDEAPCHKRQVSVSSDVSRASSSGSDSPSHRERNVEWDSLRLHPSMEVDRSPHITPPHHHVAARHGDDHRHVHIVEHSREFHRPRHSQPDHALHIYDGFDFGFGSQRQRPADGGSGGARRLRAPRSEADLHRRHRAAEAPHATIATSAPAGAPDLPPTPTRRTHPAGFDEADYFIKRGGWKRRGIVFGSSSAETHESEDDIFEMIP